MYIHDVFVETTTFLVIFKEKVQNLIQTRLTCLCTSTCKIDETYFPNKFEKISNAPFIPGRKKLNITQYIKQ